MTVRLPGGFEVSDRAGDALATAIAVVVAVLFVFAVVGGLAAVVALFLHALELFGVDAPFVLVALFG